MRSFARVWITLWVCTALIACTTMGFTPATRFTTKFANATAAYTGTTKAVARALREKRITGDDAKSYRTVAREWRRSLDVARTVYEAGDLKDAMARLILADEALKQLQKYLDSKGPPIQPSLSAPSTVVAPEDNNG